nr:scavenger receptor class F member 1-like [Crassostrea gigas]
MCDKECENGWYGENCSQQCIGNCMNNSTCNHVTGLCDAGCDFGWTGSICDKECPPGHFGTECMGNCSGNCINNTQCDPINGECSDGCIDDYIGRRCENYTVNNHLPFKNSIQPLLLIIGFSAPVVVNAFFIACTCTLIRHWKKSSRKRSDKADVPISLRSMSYARKEVASIEPDHYQYVDLPIKEMCYQNMSLY